MKEISVNIDDWLVQRQGKRGTGLAYPGTAYAHPDQIQLPANASPEERERVKALQEKLRSEWQDREELAEREDRLDKTAKDCLECGESRRHYNDDYICYRCRDRNDVI